MYLHNYICKHALYRIIFMYIIYSGSNDQYASAAVSRRDGDSTSIEYQYLGRVLDRDKGIYKSKERGMFTFDVSTGMFGSVPEDYVPEPPEDRRTKKRVSVDFGDAFFVDSFLHSSGLMDTVDRIGYGNPDTLHAMLLFYTLSGLANCDAIHWYEGNIVRLLYPNANMTSQRLSDFLSSIGSPEKQMAFQEAYLQYVMQHYGEDKNILIDSSGLPNSIHFWMTQTNIHNGKVNNEVRLIFVVQRSTGIPLYYRAVPGNIVDVSTLRRVFLHLDSLGIDISSCIMDAGYNSGDNLDLFYDENHHCRIGYITRIGSGDKAFKAMIREELGSLDEKENLVKYEDRYLFITKKKIMVGSNKDNPAWLYLGLDLNRMSDEQHKLLKRAKKSSLSTEEVYEALQTEGLFGVLSGEEINCEEILPAYYMRQAAEQIFDIAKNYTKLLPLRIRTEATFRGHLLLSFVASCAIKMIQLRLKEANLFFGSRMACLRNQKCTIYQNRIVTDEPQKEANDSYKALGIKCPEEIPVRDGRLVYTPPESGTLPPEKKKKQKKQTVVKKAAVSETQNTSCTPGKRGRPAGSKNKKTLEREALASSDVVVVKRGKGRPKGSKNKKTLEREALMAAQGLKPVNKKRGRPKGSKNKKTLAREATISNNIQQIT